VYRREIHVPLLIFPPRTVPERRIVPEPASLRDLPATVVDLLGLASSSPFPGRSLARFFRPGTASDSPVDPVLSEVGHQAHMPPNPMVPATLGSIRALTTEQDVYIHNRNGQEELYDRIADPSEMNSLVSEQSTSPTLQRLRGTLQDVVGRQQP
jgi:arylsulfatase A-like enzyme